MASGLFVPTFLDVLDTTQLALDLDLETHRVALFTAAVTVNFSTNTAYGVAPWNANEVTGAGYTAGGNLLTGTTFTESPAGTVTFDANDASWPTSTITGARYAHIYADALAGNNSIVAIDFGANYDTTAGTLTIQWSTLGIFYIDLTP